MARSTGPRAAAYSLRCAGASAVPNDDGTSALHCRAEQRADGLYVVEFVPLVRGEFVVNVSVYAGAYGSRKLGNLPGKMVVQVDAAPVATCARFRNCTDHGVCNFLTVGASATPAGMATTARTAPPYAARALPTARTTATAQTRQTHGGATSAVAQSIMRVLTAPRGCRRSSCLRSRGQSARTSALVMARATPHAASAHASQGGVATTAQRRALHHRDALGRQLVLDFSPSTRRFGVYAVHKAQRRGAARVRWPRR